MGHRHEVEGQARLLTYRFGFTIRFSRWTELQNRVGDRPPTLSTLAGE
jgi:hypothetical protein